MIPIIDSHLDLSWNALSWNRDLTEPLGRSQPTVSHHLTALTEAGLIVREKRGRWAWFRVVPEPSTLLGTAAVGCVILARRYRR